MESWPCFLQRSILPTAKELNRRGWGRKSWVGRKGQACGGRPWDKANLRATLNNPAYIGLVRFKGDLITGEHEAIVDRKTWDAVQAILTRNRREGGATVRNKHGALLRGLLRCGSCNVGMHHTYSKKGDRLYRYYVCHHALKRGWDVCPTKSVPAGEIEKFVVEQIRAIGQDPALTADVATRAREQAKADQRDLHAEDTALRRSLREAAREVAKCVGGPDSTRRLADLQERIRASENRLAEIAAELEAARGTKATAASVTSALRGFDGAWEGLNTAERTRLLALLIERITYDGEAGTMAITFRPNGFETITDEQTTDD